MNLCDMWKGMRRLWNRLAAVWYFYCGRDYECLCGHVAKRKTKISIGHEWGVYVLDQKREHCPNCFMNAMAYCAWCSRYILPGSPITLYTPRDPNKLPPHARVYKRTPKLMVVGCLRMDCAQGGMDRMGFWVMPGKVKRVASPTEVLLAQMEKGDFRPLIVHDLADEAEAVAIDDGEVP
jgi:hypothetical protein